MDDNELGRQVGTAMREAFPDHADLTMPPAAIRAQRPIKAHGMRRTVLVASAAASVVLLAITIVAVKILTSRGAGVHARPGERQSSSPNPSKPWVRATVDTLTFRHPANWISVPPGGPPTPGLVHIAEYLTDASVARDCRTRDAHGMTPLRCNPPSPALSSGQVLIWISEGIYPSDAIRPARIVRGHRTRIQSGQVTSFPTAPADCPTGTTNYLQMTIDGRLASDETHRLRRFEFNGYTIAACANSPTKTIPITIRDLIHSVRITE